MSTREKEKIFQAAIDHVLVYESHLVIIITITNEGYQIFVMNCHQKLSLQAMYTYECHLVIIIKIINEGYQHFGAGLSSKVSNDYFLWMVLVLNNISLES